MRFNSLHAAPSTTAIAVVLSLGVSLLVAASALATPLPPGQSVVPDDTPSPLGAHFLETRSSTFSETFLNGMLQTSVFNADPNNPNGPAALTFLFVLTNDNVGNFPVAIGRLDVGQFGGLTVDAAINLLSAPTDVRPTAADRRADGSFIGWVFGPAGADAILPGERSATLVLRTSANFYQSGLAIITDVTGNNTTADTFAATFPEPTAATCLTLLAGGAFSRRRFRR